MKFFLSVFAVFLLLFGRAQNPLAVAAFASAYQDIGIVADAIRESSKSNNHSPVLTEKMLAYLDNARIPLDERIALVNAFGTGHKELALQYEKHVIKKYRLPLIAADSMLSPMNFPGEAFYSAALTMSYQDLCILGYLESMAFADDSPFRGYRAVYEAVKREPESGIANYVAAIIRASNLFELDVCRVKGDFVACVQEVPVSKDFVRADAISMIIDAYSIYDKICQAENSVLIENPIENSGEGVQPFTREYWSQHPVYVKPAQPQISEKKMKVDLEILNETDDEEHMLDRWIFYSEEISGTRMHIRVLNKGNVQSIPTNLLVDIDNTNEMEGGIHLYIQELIPAIDPEQTIEIIVQIPYYWIYDPDADFTIILDADDSIKESNESNNKRRFHENG